MTFMTHKEWGGVYNFDKKTNHLTKVLKCYHNDGTITHDRFNYAYFPESYSEITEAEVDTIEPKYKTIQSYEGKTILLSEDY